MKTKEQIEAVYNKLNNHPRDRHETASIASMHTLAWVLGLETEGAIVFEDLFGEHLDEPPHPTH